MGQLIYRRDMLVDKIDEGHHFFVRSKHDAFKQGFGTMAK